MNPKYYSALKISIIFLVIGSLYIVFSDNLVLKTLGDSISAEALNKIQSFKGLMFVFLTSVFLFILIFREINLKQKTIEELERQQKILKETFEEKNKLSTQLRERNHYIETILDNIPLGVAVNKLDGGTAIYLNKKFEEIYGWPAKELIDVYNFFEKVYPDETYRKKIQTRVISDIESGDPKKMIWEEIEITTERGEKRIVNAQNIPLLEQDLMISTVKDITQRVKTQKERNRIFENSIDMICTASYDGYFKTLNPAWENILGWSNDELRSKPFFEFIHPDDVDDTLKAAQEIAKGKTALRFKNRYATKSGEYKWLSWNTIPIPEENIMFGIARDVTLNKKAEEELQQSKALLEKTINSLNEVVLVINPKNRTVVLANSAINKIFGYKPSEVIGKTTEILHLNHEKYKEFADTGEPILEKQGKFHTEFKMKHKNGSVIETENIVTSIKDENDWESGVVSVIRDITDRKNNEKRLREYQHSLQNLTTELSLAEEKQRKEIAANIHDHLSQLLVISKMKITDLKNDEKSKERQSKLSTIINHISEALENSRRITYDLSPPILYEMGLVETMYWLAEKIEAENNINLHFKTNTDNLKLPEAKLIFLFRSIQELLYNAIKHAQAKNIISEFKLENNLLKIIVKDDGKGFAPSEIEKSKSVTKSFGLFAVKERIQNLGGKFSIQSDLGKGSEAKIEVPIINKTTTKHGN